MDVCGVHVKWQITAVTNLDEQGCYIKCVRVISMSDVDSEQAKNNDDMVTVLPC